MSGGCFFDVNILIFAKGELLVAIGTAPVREDSSMDEGTFKILASSYIRRYNGLPIGKGFKIRRRKGGVNIRIPFPVEKKQGKEIEMEKDKETRVEESRELLEDIKESIEEAVCVARCVRISAEATCEDISLIRGMGAVEKLLMHISRHDLAELETMLLGMQR